MKNRTQFAVGGWMLVVALVLLASILKPQSVSADPSPGYAAWELEIPKGEYSGHSAVNKFGANTAVAADTTEDVWDGGGTYVFPTSTNITHVSQTANQAAMTNAAIQVQGLDVDWVLTVQTVALDGSDTTTAVELTTPLRRVFRMKVLADVVSASPIRAHNAAESVDYAIIGTGNNQTLMAIYTVPAGYTAYMTQYYATQIDATSKTPTSVKFRLWTSDRDSGYAFQLKHLMGIPEAGAMIDHRFAPFFGPISEKTDIKISALPLDQAADVAAGFDIVLVEN